jgi:hypothetical protein
MFRKQRSFVFLSSWLLVVEYSQERIAKNNAPISNCPMLSLRQLLSSLSMDIHTVIGRHAWCVVGGSLFLYALIWFTNIVDFCPDESIVGSGLRFCLKACTTFEMAALTVPPVSIVLEVNWWWL